MPFDQNPNGGGGDDPRHDSDKMFKLLKEVHADFVRRGAKSGLCRSCSTMNLAALLITEVQLELDDEGKRRSLEILLEKVADWVVLNEKRGDKDTLIFHV